MPALSSPPASSAGCRAGLSVEVLAAHDENIKRTSGSNSVAAYVSRLHGAP